MRIPATDNGCRSWSRAYGSFNDAAFLTGNAGTASTQHPTHGLANKILVRDRQTVPGGTSLTLKAVCIRRVDGRRTDRSVRHRAADYRAARCARERPER
jgi:hypothetical protein